ncbi:response regulator [Mariprofundus ferrooxydans]|uniref:response regulator n=1 Tax=Mariprofundus ferrooxydans TaxID=314344 RepID=UPI0014315F7C|nr:response regulator [Mariprofundus ferrooxydans]
MSDYITEALQNRRVLIADDDTAVRKLLVKIMTKKGFDVTDAEDGKRALELYRHAAGGFDLLMTDICMPEMNGCDLIREIRRQDQCLPIIVVSGYADPDLVIEIESCNATLFEKPIDFRALYQCLDSLQSVGSN